MPDDPEVQYNRAQFEAAYRALVQCAHAIRHIEVAEVKRWVQNLTTEVAADPSRNEGLNRLLTLLDAFGELRETMKKTGVPRQPPLAQEAPPSDPQRNVS